VLVYVAKYSKKYYHEILKLRLFNIKKLRFALLSLRFEIYSKENIDRKSSIAIHEEKKIQEIFNA